MVKHPVLVCESQYLSRIGLKCIIQKHPQYDVLGEASSLEEMEAKLTLKPYEIITIDITTDGEFGLESISLVQELAPKAHIVVISNERDKRHIYEILSRGINHYITKNCREDEIFKALDGARAGEKYYCSRVLDIIINKTFGREKEEVSELTEREREIVQLIAQGKVAKEIAGILHISIHTIYTHRKNVMKKLNISSPVELITYAINKGLVQL